MKSLAMKSKPYTFPAQNLLQEKNMLQIDDGKMAHSRGFFIPTNHQLQVTSHASKTPAIPSTGRSSFGALCVPAERICTLPSLTFVNSTLSSCLRVLRDFAREPFFSQLITNHKLQVTGQRCCPLPISVLICSELEEQAVWFSAMLADQ
jgi:hypothetical protein